MLCPFKNYVCTLFNLLKINLYLCLYYIEKKTKSGLYMKC